MNKTSADEVIIHALWPGPDDDKTFGAPLVTYASRSATRVARSVSAGAGSAHAAPVKNMPASAAPVVATIVALRLVALPIARVLSVSADRTASRTGACR